MCSLWLHLGVYRAFKKESDLPGLPEENSYHSGGRETMKKLILAGCLVLIAAMMIVPVSAFNILPGNHYSNAPIYESKYAAPPVDEVTKISQSTGAVFIHATSGGMLDGDARAFTIADYNGPYTKKFVLGVNGWFDTRLEAGKYTVVFPKGTGSSTELNTWKQETKDFVIAPGSRADVLIIGAGCSGNDICPRMYTITSAKYGAGAGTDVTTAIQSIVNAGRYSFYFDSAGAPAGIYTAAGGTLLYATPVGAGNAVNIIYLNGCEGAARTITTTEGVQITL